MALVQPDLNKPVFQMDPKAKRSVELGACPVCKQAILEEDFKDELSKREYSISGLCFMCQEAVFGE